MTRLEALQKLISVEPIARDELYRVCGWPNDEVDALLRRLIEDRVIVHSSPFPGVCRQYRIAA